MPELVDERPGARPAKTAERLGLAAGAIEREHQLAAQPLAQRVLGDRAPPARPTSAAWRRARDRRRYATSSAASRSSSRRAISLCANGSNARSASARAAPQRQRLAQALGGRASGAPGRARARPSSSELLEAVGVELARVDAQQVAVAARHEDVPRGPARGRAPCAAARRRPARVFAASGGGSSPHSSSISRSARDDFVGVQQQDREQRALLMRSQRVSPADRAGPPDHRGPGTPRSTVLRGRGRTYHRGR